MFELEHFHEACLTKFTDVSGGHILDLYISDSMQDMLDIDIKSEVATVVGGASEFTLMNFDLPLLDFDPNSSFNEDSSHSDESSGASSAKPGQLPKWSERSISSSYGKNGGSAFGLDYLESPITSMPSSHSHHMQHSHSNSIHGFPMSQCVNPNSVMPPLNTSFNKVLKSYTKANAGLAGRRNGYNTNLNEISVNQTNSPCEKKSHLNFSPMRFNANGKQPQQKTTANSYGGGIEVKVEPEEVIVALQQQQQQQNSVNMIRKNLANDMLMMNASGVGAGKGHQQQKARSASPVVHSSSSSPRDSGNRIELAFGGLNGLSYSRASSQSPLTVNGAAGRDSNSRYNNTKQSNAMAVHHHHGTRTVSGRGSSSSSSSTTASSPSLYHSAYGSGTKMSKSKIKHAPNDFPKPAYSYSCLIAMALKNSRSGSLPVSEIYNFMCEHFPYFKTAPNGWKNSVRHNLSLNKCFDKIEKPATNGGQRKGCLWAMNPSKVSKMDEEVQKWSRKDPMAIRRAMVHPENLGALERGELKHGNFDDEDDDYPDDEDEGVNTEDGSEVDGDEEQEDRDVDVVGSHAHQQHQQITTMAGRRVYRRPVMLSEEFEMDDDVDDEDYEVRARKRRRGSSSTSAASSAGKYERQQSQQNQSQRLYQTVVRPVSQNSTTQHQQYIVQSPSASQQQRQRSRSRSNSPSVKMVLKQQQQRRLLMANSNQHHNGGGGGQQQFKSSGQLLRLQQIKQEAMDTEESEGEEEEEEFEDEDIFPSGGMIRPKRIQMAIEGSDDATDEEVQGGNQMMHLSTLIGEQADHLIASGNFDVESADFYDEIEIADFDAADRKDLIQMIRGGGDDGSSFVVPDGGIDLESCHLDMQLSSGNSSAAAAKKQRLDVNYSVQKVQQAPQGGSRRKMPLVNRIL